MGVRRSTVAHAAAISLAALLVACADMPAGERRLDADYMTGTGGPRPALPMREFTPPDDAGASDAEFTGTLTLDTALPGTLDVLRDYFDRVGAVGDDIRRLPPFHFDFVQRGDDLLPIRRGVIRTEHPYWEYILQPGRVWREPGDGRWSRAALPFSLQEQAANCTHYGMLTWLFDSEGNVSRVAYQVSSETCAYFRFDLRGILPADFEPGAVRGARAAIQAFDAHAAASLPVRPVEALAATYPGFDAANLGPVEGVLAEHMTVYGLLVDGVHYRSGCQTRQGLYPFCGSLPLPSYSTAKSIFGAVALMRLEQRYPGLKDRSIASLVPECASGPWADVTLEDALDMTTGNYAEPDLNVDENSGPHVAFIFEPTHEAKLAFACSFFPRKTGPGTRWVYHTSDTYLLGTALQNFLRAEQGPTADLYADVMVADLWEPLRLSPLLDDSKRTYDDAAQPLVGWGLTYEADDIIRISHWLAVENGAIDGRATLDRQMLDAALQRDPADPGFAASAADLRYNNAFWAYDAGPSFGCDRAVWVPFLRGFGGIVVVMLPNGSVYYHFSDGYTHAWRQAAAETQHVRDNCR